MRIIGDIGFAAIHPSLASLEPCDIDNFGRTLA
jgi:hypothetical protein